MRHEQFSKNVLSPDKTNFGKLNFNNKQRSRTVNEIFALLNKLVSLLKLEMCG